MGCAMAWYTRGCTCVGPGPNNSLFGGWMEISSLNTVEFCWITGMGDSLIMSVPV